MRHTVRILAVLAFLLFYGGITFSQTASWSAYKPTLFPTNSSGQINGISRVSQMKFHPSNSQKMYAVSARGGLFISTNAGTTWAVASGCDALTNGTRFASVCIDHTNDQILYLGGGDHNYYSNGSGVWKSTNGGGTFTPTTLTGKIVVEMIMDPANNSIIVAATNTGIYKTTDAGATWTLKTSSIAFDDMKKKENNGTRVLFASTRNAELYVSNDFGDTWTQITSGIYIPTGYTSGGGTRIGLTPADSNYVYFYMNAKGGTLFRSVNGGTSFTAVKDALSPFLTGYSNNSADPGQGDYNTGLGVDRSNRNTVYFVAHNVWKSTDGGANWTQLTNWYEKVHTDMHQMTVSPYNTSQVWNMNDGGIWVSTDGGNNWTQKSDGIYGYEIYHGSCSPTRRDMMSIGTQDNGELYGNTTTWYTNRGGDWQSHCVFDYRSNSSTVYYFLPDWGSVSLPKRRSVTGSESTYGLPSTLADIYDIAFHRSNSNIAFAGDTGIYRTTNLTAASPTWTKIYTATSAVMKIHVNYADPNRLYIITADQKIHISSNALSATPTFTVVSLPNASSVEAHITTIKSSPNTVYITANTKVYRSTDNGATWTNITYNLPSTNHSEIIADEYFSSNELVFLSTGGVVYYKTATASAWSIFNTNLPSRTTIVDMSIFNDSTSNTTLRVFTYGRGVWETPINSLRSMTPNFVADNTAPCVGAFVNFSDLSTGNVTSRNWSFPGGTPSSSTSPNPVVNYSTSGTFTVSLTVSDGTTSTSITRADYINTQGKSLPVAESYESGVFPPPNWTNVDASLDSKAWSQYSGAGGFGSSANCMYYDNFSVDAGGAYDEFRSIAVDLKAFTAASLKFDVAYQPYSLTSYIDSFQVLLSTNCGNTFTSLYLKYGSGLNTTGTTSTTEFVPAAGQWRQETISLNQFLNNSVVIAFRNIGHFGNNLYIDNILIEGTPVVLSAGPDKTICSGSTAGIGSSPVSGMIYSWFPTTGLSSGTSSNPVASPATTTTYVLTGTVSSSGYTTRDTVVVTVNTAPTITFNPPASLCKNAAPTLLSATPSGGTFAGTGVTGNQFDPSVGPGTFTVTYTVTATNGCVSTSTKNIQVNTVSLTAAVTAVSCNGQSNGAIDLTPTAGSGNYSYAWSNGATTQDLTAITAGTYDVTLTDVTTGCTASGTYSVTQPATIVLSNIAPASASSGTTVVITGSGFTGVTDVKVNNVSVGPSNYTVNSSTQISMTVTPSMTSGPVTVVCGSCSGSSATSFIKTGINLTVRVLIQGYYSGSSAMRPVLLNQGISGATTSMSDTVEVRLYRNTAPPVLVESKKVVLSQFGTGTISMPATPAGTYWIVVVHRNSIETWSSNPVALNTSTVTYNFTSSASMAYGNNMVLLSTGQWGIYSGNLPAQDNAIDVNDLQQLEQAIQNGIVFGYNYHDLTGDGIVESADFSLLENNQGVQVVKP